MNKVNCHRHQLDRVVRTGRQLGAGGLSEPGQHVRAGVVSPRSWRTHHRLFGLHGHVSRRRRAQSTAQTVTIQLSHFSSLYTVSRKNCAKLFFCQSFVKFPPILIIFGRKMAKRQRVRGALIFHLTYFASPHYRDKCRCCKLLHNAVIISIRLLTFASHEHVFVGLNILLWI